MIPRPWSRPAPTPASPARLSAMARLLRRLSAEPNDTDDFFGGPPSLRAIRAARRGLTEVDWMTIRVMTQGETDV